MLHQPKHAGVRGATISGVSRRWCFGVVASAAVMAATGGCADDGRDNPAPDGADCRPSVRYASTQGAGGNITAVFEVAVRSSYGCALQGFPSVRLVDRHGKEMPTLPMRRGADATGIPNRRVALHPDRPGRFLIIYKLLRASGRPCLPGPHAIRVRLPGDDRWLTVPVDRPNPQLRVFAPCGGAFIVSPVGYADGHNTPTMQ
jgi:hypothetical protein